MLSEVNFRILLDSIEAMTDCRLGGVQLQLRPKAWAKYLCHDGIWDDKSHYILDGVTNGFRVLNSDPDIDCYRVDNYRSCYKLGVETKLTSLIESEIGVGKLSVSNEFPKCIHALGAVRKSSGSYRPITDCSRPTNVAVNYHMNEVFNSFTFVSLQEVLDSIERGMFLSVIDLQAAYRSVAIHPNERSYFGLFWQSAEGAPMILNDNFLCFGTRTAPAIFNTLSQSIVRMLQHRGIWCHGYLDDFLLGSNNMNRSCSDLCDVIRLFRELGFYVSYPKLQDPSTKVIYLGFLIDTELMTCKLPNEKLRKVERELGFWDTRKRATKRQLQRLSGTLSHACRVVRGGKLYMHHIFDAILRIDSQKYIGVSDGFRQDLKWWKLCCEANNGIPIQGEEKCQMIQLMTFEDGESWQTCSELGMLRGTWSGNDVTELAYSKKGDEIILFVPENERDIGVVRDLTILWCFITEFFTHLTNCTLVFYCHRFYTHKALSRLRSKHESAILLLKQIFNLCNNASIHLYPFHDPLQ